METTLSIFKQLPETKAQVETFANQTIEIIRNGYGKPIELSIQLKALETALKKISDGIKDITLEEVAKFGKNHETASAKIDIAMVGVKYDYSVCGDEIWNDLDKQEQDIKEQKKERETFLKSIKGQLTCVNEITGEVVTIHQANKSGSESIKITLK